MKKKVISILIVTLMVSAALYTPKYFEKSVIPVQITKVATTTFTNDIFVSGVVEELSKKDVIVQLPLVPSKVYYGIGDKVKLNDVLADVDVEATTAALFDLTDATNLIPQEYVAAIAGLNIDDTMINTYVPKQIVAPADGVVTAISLVSGGICTPNSSVVTISNQDEIRLKMSVSENDIDGVQKGDTVVFKASATGEQKYVGNVDLIFPTANKTIVGTSQATVVNLYVKLSDYYQALKPGYTVSGVVKSPVARNVYILPYECIMQDADNAEFVYLINGNKVQRCDVTTGMELGDGVEILSPSLVGQRIVLNPGDIKSEDSLIKIMNN